MMVTQGHDSRRFAEKVREIRAGTQLILAQWGLRSKFSRWRLTQDPRTGLVVLFGVLNSEYITAHPSTPFNNYFDPRVLLDLTLDLNVPVVSSGSEGFRYAFILDHGQVGPLPLSVDLPGLERTQFILDSADATQRIAQGWDKPMGVVDMTDLHPLSERYEVSQALAGFQWTIMDAQTTAAPRPDTRPAIMTSNRSLDHVVAIPAAWAQAEAEVGQRTELYEPWSGNAKDLNAPNADYWLMSRAELVRRLRWMLASYDDSARPAGKSERPLDKATRIAGARRKRGIVSLSAEA